MGELIRSKEKKRRIGVFVHNLRVQDGGSYQYVEFILDALVDCIDLYDVTVVCTIPDWETIVSQRYSCFKLYKVIFSFDKMTEEIDSLGFEFLIFPLHGETFFYELDFKTPLVASIHDLMYYYVPKPGVTYLHSTLFYQALHRRAIGIFVDSELSRKQYGELFGCTSVEKVYALPFRIPRYLYEKDEEYVSINNEKFIFYPAQMGAHKNHLNLILAVDYLRKQNIDVNLVFSGKNNGISEYICSLIHELRLGDQIEIAGFLNESQIKYLYSHARAMIMPTFDGPTNIPPIEAMFMGCPVAVSNIFAMPEQVENAGLLFDPNSVTDIADTIAMLWTDDDLCKSLSESGKKQAEKFSKEVFNKRFRETLSTIIFKHEEDNYYMNDLIHQCKKYKQIYLYGAERLGFLIGNQLRKKHGINICGYIVSSYENEKRELSGIQIYELDTLKRDWRESLVVLTLSEKYHTEIIKCLHNKNINNIYVIKPGHHLEAWSYFVNMH